MFMNLFSVTHVFPDKYTQTLRLLTLLFEWVYELSTTSKAGQKYPDLHNKVTRSTLHNTRPVPTVHLSVFAEKIVT